MANRDSDSRNVTGRMVARYTLIVVAVVATALFVWEIREALLLAFAGLIVAILICGMARGVRRFKPLSRTASLAAVGAGIVIILAIFGLLMGPQIGNQFDELADELPQQFEQVQQQIRDTRIGGMLMGGGEEGGGDQGQEQPGEDGGGQDGEGEGGQSGGQNGGGGGGQGGGGGGFLFDAGSTLLDALSSLILVLFVGIFFAINPRVYRRGITLLVTKDREERVDEALEASGNALWQWLMGQLIAMAFVGVGVAIGLWIVGVPLALILGLIAGLFDFVPFVGPIVAAVPGVLLALAEGPQEAMLAVLVYLVVQQIEGYIVTPLVQRKKVSLPPALILLSVVAFGVVFGILGIVLATPLAVLALVLIRMLYIQDVLGKDVPIPGNENG